MATSSSSSMLQNSGSEEDLNLMNIMNQRKRKRMISNRESARRSRMRKQKHLDDLKAQVAQLRTENNQILTSLNMATQIYLNIEAENSVLSAQMGELSHRLQSLNEIIEFANSSNGIFEVDDQDNAQIDYIDGFLNPWSSVCVNSSDIFTY